MPLLDRARSVMAAAVLVAAVAGCSSPEPPASGTSYPPPPAQFQQDAAERDSVVSMLQAADPGRLQAAFANLRGVPHTRSTRTERLGADGTLIAAVERTVRYAGPDATPALRILAADTVGTIEGNVFAGLAPSDTLGLQPAALSESLVPEDPAYLEARNFEAFFYRLLPDTTVAGAPVRVAEVWARPETGTRQPVRRARFYVDDAAGALYGLYLERVNPSALFEESSTVRLHVAPLGNGPAVPRLLQVETALKMPLRRWHRLRTQSTYVYESALGSSGA